MGSHKTEEKQLSAPASKKQLFAAAYTSGHTQGDARASAIAAGYATSSASSSSSKLLKHPAVRQMIRDYIGENLTVCATVASQVGMDMMRDEDTPPAVRAQLVKTFVTAFRQEVQDNQEVSKDTPLNERSRQELEAFVKAGVEKVADLRGGAGREKNLRVINHLE